MQRTQLATLEDKKMAGEKKKTAGEYNQSAGHNTMDTLWTLAWCH